MRAVLAASAVVIAISLCLPYGAWAAPCPDGIVGNSNGPPSIQIGSLPQPSGASGTVAGTVNNVRTGSVRVSIWAHTDRYYPQPFLTAPFTCVSSNGSWSSFTNPWKRVIVLLVDDSYVIPAGPAPLPSSIDYHPSTDSGVLAWAEIPPSRTLAFAGETWWVKDSAPFSTDPGPCVFSPGTQNVFVDGDGRLHLEVVRRGSTWTCSEIVLDRSRGHGVYTFQVTSTLDHLDAREVFSGFLFESLTREIDVECSPALTGLPNGCQYVVQPFGTPGNRRIFSIPAGPSTHRIYWVGDHVWFLSWRGVKPFPPDPQDVIQSFNYTGPNIPPAGGERMRFNLWLTGASPSTGNGSEVVVQSFRYCPSSTYPVSSPSVVTSLKLNATPSLVHPGEKITVGLTANNPSIAFVADLFLGLVLPDQTLCFFTALSPLGTACFPANSDPRAFPRLADALSVPAGLDVNVPQLLTYPVAGGGPVGDHLFFGVLTPPGAISDGGVDACDLLFASTASSRVQP